MQVTKSCYEYITKNGRKAPGSTSPALQPSPVVALQRQEKRVLLSSTHNEINQYVYGLLNEKEQATCNTATD